MTKNVICRVVFLSLGILLIASASYGQTQINGAVSGNWSNTASWSPATVPNNMGLTTYDVTLLSSPAVTITLDISPTIDALTLDSGSELTTDASTTLTTTGLTNAGYINFANGNTLTVNGATTTSGTLVLGSASKGNFNGNFSNSGAFYTDGGSTVTVSGTLTNSNLVYLESSGDVLNVSTLTNTGEIIIDAGATLNLTGGGQGITTVVAGSNLDVAGTLNVINGTTATNGLANLTTVAGTLAWENGKTLTDTPAGGTLTINSGGALEVYNASTLLVSNVSNSGAFYTDGGSTVTVSGTLTNSNLVYLESSGDVLNVSTLTNTGEIIIDAGATLNLTGGGQGITTVVAGSNLDVAGTLNVINGTTATNGLANLTTVAGTLAWENGKTLTDTPAGGTLTINSGGALEVYNASTLLVSNVSNSGAFYTDGGSTVTVSGTLTNSNLVYLESSGDVLNVSTLTNTGEIIIDAGATLNLTGGGQGITTVVAGSNLDVAGTLNVINGTTATNGLANLTTVAGTLAWENGKTLTDTPAGGTLTINSGGALEVYNASTLLVSNVSNSGAFYTDGGSTVTVSGTLTNSNLVYLESSGDVLNVSTLTNTGEIIIDAGATLNLTGGGQGITTVVAGSNLDVAGTLNVINGTTATNGLANLTTVAGTLAWENGKTLTDTPAGGTLTINSGGALEVYNASTLLVSNVSNSGAFYTDSGSTVTVSGTLTNSNLVYLESSGDVLNVSTLTNTGTIDINPGATLNLTGATSTNSNMINLSSGGILKISASKVTISGAGKIDLTGTNSVIEGMVGTDVLTLAKGSTIEGAGNIGNNLMTLNNQGTINANTTASTLTLQMSGGTTNSGTMEATLGAILQLDAGNYTQTSAGAIIASETGNATSTVNLESGVSITGGKLTTIGTTATIDLVGTSATLTLNGVSISGNGSVQLADGSTTTLLGNITNTGTVDVNSTGDTTTLYIGANPVTLSGTGKIILASNGKDVITGGSGDTLHNGNTIEGPGNIGNGVIGVVNTGTIETVAHQTGNTEIDAGSAGFNNQGTVEAVAGTTLYIDNASNQFLNFNSGTDTLAGGTYIVDGTLEFDGANIVTNNASITLSGTASKIVNQSNANGLANLATNGGTFALAAGRNFTTIGNFTNNGTLNIGGGTKFDVGTNGAADLTNYSSDTLTGGTYLVTGTLQFNNESTTMGIVTNDASITLSGTTAKIEDQNGVSMLANLATNGTGSTFALASSAKFTTSGNFTNSGTLNVGTGSLFAVGASGADSLTNFSSGTNTLTGGSYIATGTGQIQFNNGGGSASIVTNAASITLSGSSSTASFINQTGANMLANFATNSSSGSFTLSSSRAFTTAAGFTNAGLVEISKTTTLSIGANGNYTQTAGSTTVDGTLTLGSAAALNISGGSLFGNGGTINGAVDLTAGNVNPGDGAGLVGDIKVNGNYTQGSSGDLNVDIAGTAPNTLYSVLNIVDAASLSGTLNVNLENGFVPKVNTKFTIVDYKSETGTFATVNFPTVSGDHWSITYNPTNVVIELLAGPGATVVTDNLSSASASSAAAQSIPHGNPAARISRIMGAVVSSNTREPVAILSHVTCRVSRLVGSGTCDKASASSHGGETALHVTSSSSSTIGAAPHNNIMVATRSISAARGDASHETSATAMARLYVCAYLPSTVGHTMGCN